MKTEETVLIAKAKYESLKKHIAWMTKRPQLSRRRQFGASGEKSAADILRIVRWHAYKRVLIKIIEEQLQMIKKLDKNEIKEALELVNTVFAEFVSVDYSERGNKTFNDYLITKLEEVTNDVQNGHKKIWGYYQDYKIIGVIAIRDKSHIALMFVDKHHHKKGIARQLYGAVLSEIRNNTDATRVTVNSSPYAVPVYERLGFIKTAEQQEHENGIIYVPMSHTIREITGSAPA